MPGEETNISMPGMSHINAFMSLDFFFNLLEQPCKINVNVLILKIRILRLKEMKYFA